MFFSLTLKIVSFTWTTVQDIKQELNSNHLACASALDSRLVKYDRCKLFMHSQHTLPLCTSPTLTLCSGMAFGV